MACRGVLFALTDKDRECILSCRNDDELIDYVQETIEYRWDKDWLLETDKAWDAIHRCFADGKMLSIAGSPPLNGVIFGGRILNTGSDYFVSYKDLGLVRAIAKTIDSIGRVQLKALYDKIGNDYDDKSDADFDYTWEWFKNMPSFYKKCAADNRSVIFTVDQ